jgi:hypothetical protein
MSDYARVQLVDEGIKVLVVLPYITATNFTANALGRHGAANYIGVRRNLPPPHTAEFVAGKVLEGLRSDATEISLVPA